MTTEITGLTFKIFFLMEEFRELLRKTAPLHNFNEDEKKESLGILDEIMNLVINLRDLI